MATAIALLLALTATGGAAPAAIPCPSPPGVFPESLIVAGMAGTGRTVVAGGAPVDFDVEVLGVLPDGIAPGLDFILVQVTGPQTFLDQTHGIAAGMSGSPVYIQGQLAGAISYGLGLADHTVGGMTPAQPMVDLFGYPTGPPASLVPRLAHRVVLPAALGRAVARAARLPVGVGTITAEPLATPLGVSGLSDRRLRQLQAMLNERNLPFLVYRSGAAAAPTTTLVPAPLQDGGNFVSVQSYGDVTFGGLGTATVTCGDSTVAFGHPLFYYPAGPTTLGMNDANVLTVLDDPSGIQGPFKLAAVGPAHGMVTQDRYAGELGVAGSLPPLVPVQTQFSNPDLSRSRTGETDIAYQQDFGVPSITLFHVVSNLDVVFDRVGDGTLRMDWSIRGLRADGSTPWEVVRSDMFHSDFDATEGAFELFRELNRIAFNGFEDVTFTGIQANGFITQRDIESELVGLRSSSPVQPSLRERGVLRVKPGGSIHLQAILRPVKGGPTQTVDFSMRVPRGARRGGVLVVQGGGKRREGEGGTLFFRPAAEPKPGGHKPTSFDELIEKLNSRTPSYDLVANLSTPRSTTTTLIDAGAIVLGRIRLELEVPR